MLPTGYDLVKIFCEKGLRANKIFLHTDNGVGRENMYHTLKGAQRRGFIDKEYSSSNYLINSCNLPYYTLTCILKHTQRE
ncbi:cyclic-phosphate processing receiver domain-containing protein [Oceanobacillus sp. E9]|uniref:cyclic-phosphate processing receiver domain-containing protein n=1 Tax=Oceanobacillus sp. E9 TaxID=1742575 RepID=UPI0026AECEAB